MNENSVTFFVRDEPKPGGSKKAFVIKKTGRAVIVDDCKGNKDWRTAVKWAAKEAMNNRPLFTGPVKLVIKFYMKRSNSHYGTGKNAGVLKSAAPYYHVNIPDCLKLARSTEDALTGIVWVDDKCNCSLRLDKYYSDNHIVGALVVVVERPDNLRPKKEVDQ